MSNSDIAARLIHALEAEADREAGRKTALVSVTIEVIAGEAPGSISVSVARKTRSLVFMAAELTSEAGVRIAAASSVHKLSR